MTLIQRFRRLSLWNKLAAIGSLASVAGLTLTAILQVCQAGREIDIPSQNATVISSMSVEARLTCDIRPEAELPPSEVEFYPLGESHVTLKGPGGHYRLSFQSPVRFIVQPPSKIAVLNHFGLDDGTLQGRSMDSLLSYDSLSVPIVTVVYGKACKRMRLLEVTLFLNGDIFWSGRWTYDDPFPGGSRFEIPLDELHKRIESLNR